MILFQSLIDKIKKGDVLSLKQSEKIIKEYCYFSYKKKKEQEFGLSFYDIKKEDSLEEIRSSGINKLLLINNEFTKNHEIKEFLDSFKLEPVHKNK